MEWIAAFCMAALTCWIIATNWRISDLEAKLQHVARTQGLASYNIERDVKKLLPLLGSHPGQPGQNPKATCDPSHTAQEGA